MEGAQVTQYVRELKYEDLEAFRQIIIDVSDRFPSGGHLVLGVMMFVIDVFMNPPKTEWLGCRVYDWWHMWRISEWQHRQARMMLVERGLIQTRRVHEYGAGNGHPLLLYSSLPNPGEPVQGGNVHIIDTELVSNRGGWKGVV